LLRCLPHGLEVEATISLRQALFWMNIHLALLDVQQKALGQMRALVAAHFGRREEYDPDVLLVESEIERVLVRLMYWEEMVDRANRAVAIP
jgi:hypothetical protein